MQYHRIGESGAPSHLECVAIIIDAEGVEVLIDHYIARGAIHDKFVLQCAVLDRKGLSDASLCSEQVVISQYSGGARELNGGYNSQERVVACSIIGDFRNARTISIRVYL